MLGIKFKWLLRAWTVSSNTASIFVSNFLLHRGSLERGWTVCRSQQFRRAGAIWIWFLALVRLRPKESSEENYGNIEVTTTVSKLQARCIVAHGCTQMQIKNQRILAVIHGKWLFLQMRVLLYLLFILLSFWFTNLIGISVSLSKLLSISLFTEGLPLIKKIK